MKSIKQAVNQQFSPMASNYRTSAVHAGGEDLSEIAWQVQQQRAPHLLDAGCGAGHTAVTVAPHSQQVIALDLSAAMLAQVAALAREKGLTNLETRHGDVEALPFEAAQFDIVTSRYSAHHWPDPRQAVREIARVLKPGGRFILSDIVAPEQPAQDTFLQAFELLRDPSHVRDHSISQWQAMLTEAGFTTEVAFTWRLPLDFAAWVQRIGTPALNISMLKTLFDNAPDEIRAWLNLQADYRFTIDGALFVATLAA